MTVWEEVDGQSFLEGAYNGEKAITRWTQKLKTQVTLGRVDASEE